jgi:hypothetical protein
MTTRPKTMTRMRAFSLPTLLAAIASVQAFAPFPAPAAHRLPSTCIAPLEARGAPSSALSSHRVMAPCKMYYQQQERKVVVHRGGLGLVWPHIHLASLLMSAVVAFFLRLSRPAAHALAESQHPPERTQDPVIIAGSLCELVVDSKTGHEFCVCLQPVEHEGYSNRRAEKNGHWAYYVVKK